ncbi:MAG: Gfo/Idh/MocA family oxidoreductase [SAR202 cluster bacterium]|jgi:predicted dehydrogenase|nr:Gfo/Idh/MocA family oxidoreductase [SAR202 cluster bacterium]
MGNKRVRLGIVGAGNVTVNHYMPRFQAIDGVDLVAVANRTRESAEIAADTLGIPVVYDHWNSLMEDPDIDAVYIGTWPYMHRTLVLKALENEKHVLTQARMASSVSEAREMLAASLLKPHLIAQVVSSSILPPNVMRKLIDLVNNGPVGKVLSADFTLRQGFTDHDPDFAWRHDRDLSGFNIMMVGARYESLMRILGPATSVTAITKLSYPMRRDGNMRVHTSIPDHAEVISDLAGGGTLHMAVSTVTGLGPPSELWVFGTEGTVRCLCDPPINVKDQDPTWLWLGTIKDPEMVKVSVPDPYGTSVETAREFIAAIRGEQTVGDTTFVDGLRYVEFTEAVTRSAQERQTISLPM